MKKYVVDTNVFLRFVLKDNEKLYQQAKKYFLQAKKSEVSLVLLPQVIFEIDYVLRSVYSLARKKSAETLRTLIGSPDLEVFEREILVEIVEKYGEINVDLFDIYLYVKARKQKAKVLSFDKDFAKLAKKFA